MKALQALKPLSQIKTFGKVAAVAPTETVEKEVAPVAKKPAAPKKAPAKKSAE